MKISDIITKDSVEIGAELMTKEEVLERLAYMHRELGNIKNGSRFIQKVREREGAGSGAVTGRIAITAVPDSTAESSGITALTLKEGVDYGAHDGRPVSLVFLIAGKADSDEYIELKTRLMRMLMDSTFSARLKASKTADEFIELLAEREHIRFDPPIPKKEYDCSKFLKENNKCKKSNITDRFTDLFTDIKSRLGFI